MTRLSAHRNAVLGLVAVMAIAGCATTLHSAPAAPAHVSTAGAPTTSATASNTGTVDQQVGSIDNQLSTIDSQLNAAGDGLSTSEGDPAQ
jgi:curli biogenesis system outer membrane secretion channel CsgG